MRDRVLPSFVSADVQRRVLLVGNFLHASVGTYCVCEELALELRRAGWRVLTTSEKRARVPRLADMLTTIWRRRHDYIVAQVDVYSGAAFVWAEAAGWMLRRARKPYVLTLHGGALPRFARRWPGRVRRLLGSAHAVTTPSTYLREQLATFRDDSCVVPNAMRIERYRFRRRGPVKLRLVWLRSFHEMYNPSLAIQTLALLRKDFPEVQLVMAGADRGDGSLNRVLSAAAAVGVLDRLHVQGTIAKTEVPSWLDQGDIFLNTADVDNTPVSVIEALACGLCVVSTRVGGLPYLLDDGHDALLVPRRSAAEMAGAVRRLLTEPDLARHLSMNGRHKAEQMDWQHVIATWNQLLTAAARSGRPGHPCVSFRDAG